MKNDKIFIIALLGILIIGVILPFIIIFTVNDFAKAGQIGDALGGISSPFINITAILAVLLTYYYQKRNDKKNTEKEILIEIINNLKLELDKIELKETGEKTKLFKGKDALKRLVFHINSESSTDFTEFNSYKQLITIFKYLNSTIKYISENNFLSQLEIDMLLSQIGLFYRNNLYIDKEQRGDEICKDCKIIHKLPSELKKYILEIERKL